MLCVRARAFMGSMTCDCNIGVSAHTRSEARYHARKQPKERKREKDNDEEAEAQIMNKLSTNGAFSAFVFLFDDSNIYHLFICLFVCCPVACIHFICVCMRFLFQCCFLLNFLFL